MSTSLRPDVCIYSLTRKKVCFLELTSPFEENTQLWRAKKQLKYTGIVYDAKNNGWDATCKTIEVGARGLVSMNVPGLFRWFGLTSKDSNVARKEMSKIAIKCSHFIWISRNNEKWSHPDRVFWLTVCLSDFTLDVWLLICFVLIFRCTYTLYCIVISDGHVEDDAPRLWIPTRTARLSSFLFVYSLCQFHQCSPFCGTAVTHWRSGTNGGFEHPLLGSDCSVTLFPLLISPFCWPFVLFHVGVGILFHCFGHGLSIFPAAKDPPTRYQTFQWRLQEVSIAILLYLFFDRDLSL